MAIVSEGFIFLDIPNTGGDFIRESLRSLGLDWNEVGKLHDSLRDAEFSPVWGSRPAMLMIRHPAIWLHSYYRFVRNGGNHFMTLDEIATNASSFKIFVDSYCKQYRGWLSGLFESYAHRNNTIAGRYESMIWSLSRMLSVSNVEHDRDRLWSMSDMKVSNEFNHITDELFSKIREAEKPAYVRWGY